MEPRPDVVGGDAGNTGSITGLGWSALIVAVIWAIVGGILYAVGRNSLKSVRGIPKTADTVKKIPDPLKGNE